MASRQRLKQLLTALAPQATDSSPAASSARSELAAAGGNNKKPKRCNLLYIISDQHSPFVTGCYGDPVVSTPNLDGLAARGVTLDNCYCVSPICTPARMSMLTGRHPHQNQCWGNNDHLDTGTPTFAHAFGAASYTPVLIGRMHSNGPDQLHGYAERLVGDHQGQKGIPGGTAGPMRVSLEVSGHGQSSYQVKDECTATAAVDFFNREGQRRRALPPSAEIEPFCLSVGLMLPHQPFIARRADFDLYRGRIPPVRVPPEPLDQVHPHIAGWRRSQGIAQVPEDEIVRSRTAYWALVHRMDRLIGEMLDAMHANNLADDTLVVYTSDHGEQVGEHGLWWKQTFYEDSIRVPGILCWAGTPDEEQRRALPAGHRCDRVTSTLDISATMLDALDAPSLPSSPGRSLMPLLHEDTSKEHKWEDIAFAEFVGEGMGGPPQPYTQRMVRLGDWKLIYYHGYEQPYQLFNLRDDPKELHDRASDPACVDTLQQLSARLFDGWDPVTITARAAERKREAQLLGKWQGSVKPEQTHVWRIEPYMDYLDEDNEVGNPGALPDPTYSPPGSSVAPEAAAGDGGSAMAKRAREQ